MKKQVLVHLTIWIGFLSLFIFQIYWNLELFPFHFMILMAVNMLLFYMNYLFFVPTYLLKKQTNNYIYCVLASLLIPIIIISVYPDNGPPQFLKDKLSIPENFTMTRPPIFSVFRYIFPLLTALSFIVIGTAIKMYEEWNQNERKKKEIETYKTRSELNFLKNQLSPHFLFNSLNSIYALTTKKSDDAPEAVITLSELMRYMLYQTDNDFVSLKDELDYIQNYLKLQRLRIANNENITLNIHGNVTNQKIRPLLLISFIENAFKYGTDFKGNTEVRITINVNHNYLEFKCVNVIGHRKKDVNNSGIGLQNTTDRIALLYKHKHNLEVNEVDNKFVVYLKLKLN